MHLADLHIGKSVNGISMLGEQKHAFEQVLGYIKAERPGAVIIAGDVYDRAVPGVEAVRAFDDFLTGLALTGTAVLLIPGNHDSPERISYASRLLADRGVFLCGETGGAARNVEMADEYGTVNFCLLPYIRPLMPRAAEDGRETGYGEALAAALDMAGIDFAARNVLVSHQFYTRAGVAPMRSESEMDPIGGLDAIDAGLIERFDYAALGHLHGAQCVGKEHIRYAGSPVKYSFSEWRQQKSVTLVELAEKGSLSVAALPLVPLRDMREIRGTLESLLGESSPPARGDDYLRVVLTDEEELVDPMGKLRSAYPNIMSLGFDNTRTSIDISAASAGAEAVEKLSPYDLFSEFFLEAQGAAMSAEQSGIVRELLEEAGRGL
ncbi:MAG: exonuclease SbcCD subunit D [Oscillospiraceae bacterium]|jgi:exonuclease SbcD|nr:exonuclease SbcCD subunit D [Oscillospiraceae bacterium]